MQPELTAYPHATGSDYRRERNFTRELSIRALLSCQHHRRVVLLDAIRCSLCWERLADSQDELEIRDRMGE